MTAVVSATAASNADGWDDEFDFPSEDDPPAAEQEELEGSASAVWICFVEACVDGVGGRACGGVHNVYMCFGWSKVYSI